MTTALGGTAYTLSALGAIMKSGKIIPVCRVGYDIQPKIQAAFGCDSKFDFSEFRYTKRPSVVNRLVYNIDGARDEWNSRIAPPLAIGARLLLADAVILNFISGRDVRLADLKLFRTKFKGLIYCDYHSLSLGHGPNRKRYYRFHPQYKEYLKLADFVQMNLAELASIIGITFSDNRDLAQACRRLHEAGAGTIILTCGQNGVILSDSKTSRFYRVAAAAIKKEIDPTGCGDTLGAVFLYNYLRAGDMIESLEIANLYAAAKATFAGLDGFKNIGAIAKSIGRPSK